ncbi:MAG: DUF4365 domain-containing protein [Pseudomonadota bacterium]
MSIQGQITERIGVHKFALTILEKFNWLEREQPIADYGIDLHVEIVEDGKPTGMLYAIQIKSGKSYLKIRISFLALLQIPHKFSQYPPTDN